MRVTALLAALLVASAATAAEPRGECRRITRQIAHFEDVVDRARERDNDLWEQGTLRHIERLETRRARMCPEYIASQTRMAQTRAMLNKAARLAAAYFLK